MLGRYPVDVMLLATDLGVARRFYGDTLGLQLLLEDEQFLTFGCGGDSRLVVTKSTTGPREEATKASWRVDDLAAEVAWLRARGVQLQDLHELGTVDGVADLVRPGGRVVYSVCTFPRAETDAACDAILRHRPDLLPIETPGPGGARGTLAIDGAVVRRSRQISMPSSSTDRHSMTRYSRPRLRYFSTSVPYTLITLPRRAGFRN